MDKQWCRTPAKGVLVRWTMTLARPKLHVGLSGSRLVYLTVTRDLTYPRFWRWRLRGPEIDPETGGFVTHITGLAGTVAAAKRAATNTVLVPHCPNDGVELDTGTADAFTCPRCGDEWSPDLWPYRLT